MTGLALILLSRVLTDNRPQHRRTRNQSGHAGQRGATPPECGQLAQAAGNEDTGAAPDATATATDAARRAITTSHTLVRSHHTVCGTSGRKQHGSSSVTQVPPMDLPATPLSQQLAALPLAELKQLFHHTQQQCRVLRQNRPRTTEAQPAWLAELEHWQRLRRLYQDAIQQRMEAAKAALETAEGASLAELKRAAADAALALAHHRRAKVTDATLDADGDIEAQLEQDLSAASQHIGHALTRHGLRDAD